MSYVLLLLCSKLLAHNCPPGVYVVPSLKSLQGYKYYVEFLTLTTVEIKINDHTTLRFEKYDDWIILTVMFSVLCSVFTVWHGIIFVRQGPFAGGAFRFEMVISDRFPQDIPLLKFVSKLFHPQVHTNGWVQEPYSLLSTAVQINKQLLEQKMEFISYSTSEGVWCTFDME